MNEIGKSIYQSIINQKWVSIEYVNKKEETTKYWICVKKINTYNEVVLTCDAFNISINSNPISVTLYFDSIKSAVVLDGTYCEKNQSLIDDIDCFPEKYDFLFFKQENNNILDYYIECNKLDETPYNKDFTLIEKVDHVEILKKGVYQLDDLVFRKLVSKFHFDIIDENKELRVEELVIPTISIDTKYGLYLLAYRKLFLDVVKKTLVCSKLTYINYEFSLDNGKATQKSSIRKFIPEEELYLLDDIDNNREAILDIIGLEHAVTDMPYFVYLRRDIICNLEKEYAGIKAMYSDDCVSEPIKAFFGEVTKKSDRRKKYPITVLDNKINLDQLLAIHSAIRYPMTYVQGPPGTGKTNTIVNLLITAFYSEKTVLVCSYNNHPMDSIFDKLNNIVYRDKKLIPFNCLRLGNASKTKQAINKIKELYAYAKTQSIYTNALEKMQKNNDDATKGLSLILEKYEHKIECLERLDTAKDMIDSSDNSLNLSIVLESTQIPSLEREIKELEYIDDDKARELVVVGDAFRSYLNFTCIKYLKKLDNEKYKPLKMILDLEDEDNQLIAFNRYISEDNNLKLLLAVFPIIITTNISASKLGTPMNHFDITVLDEAGQCNTATSLIPIVRGANLVLVGDPQQLKPVVVLDNNVNAALRKYYKISDSYDYNNHSVYTTYLSNDYSSNEILLSNHYRSNRKIIEFNNKKFYNNKLNVLSSSKELEPLVFIDMKNSEQESRNSSLNEAYEVIRQIKEIINTNPTKTIGIITPFVKQSELINNLLVQNNLSHITCGTIHAFQGDEKDIIILSSAITKDTHCKTYNWLQNNTELINVATSRAKDKLIVLGDLKMIEKLSPKNEKDDYLELINYVRNNGESKVTSIKPQSRALGIKPYNSKTEAEFMQTLTHALYTVRGNCEILKEVAIGSIFTKFPVDNSLFYSGRFDFVIVEKRGKNKIPLLAIELDGKEHADNEIVIKRDKKKEEICKNHNFDFKRVENKYARRYFHIKRFLEEYFKN